MNALHTLLELKIKSAETLKMLSVVIAPIWPVNITQWYKSKNDGVEPPSQFAQKLISLSEELNKLIDELNHKIFKMYDSFMNRFCPGNENNITFRRRVIEKLTQSSSMIDGITPPEGFLRCVKLALMEFLISFVNIVRYGKTLDGNFYIASDNRLQNFMQVWPVDHPVQPHLLLGDITPKTLPNIVQHHLVAGDTLIISPNVDDFFEIVSSSYGNFNTPLQYRKFSIIDAPNPVKYATDLVFAVKNSFSPTNCHVMLASVLPPNLHSERKEFLHFHKKLALINSLDNSIDSDESESILQYFKTLNSEIHNACVLSGVLYFPDFGHYFGNLSSERVTNENYVINYFKENLNKLFEIRPLISLNPHYEKCRSPCNLDALKYCAISCIGSGPKSCIDFVSMRKKAEHKGRIHVNSDSTNMHHHVMQITQNKNLRMPAKDRIGISPCSNSTSKPKTYPNTCTTDFVSMTKKAEHEERKHINSGSSNIHHHVMQTTYNNDVSMPAEDRIGISSCSNSPSKPKKHPNTCTTDFISMTKKTEPKEKKHINSGSSNMHHDVKQTIRNNDVRMAAHDRICISPGSNPTSKQKKCPKICTTDFVSMTKKAEHKERKHINSDSTNMHHHVMKTTRNNDVKIPAQDRIGISSCSNSTRKPPKHQKTCIDFVSMTKEAEQEGRKHVNSDSTDIHHHAMQTSLNNNVRMPAQDRIGISPCSNSTSKPYLLGTRPLHHTHVVRSSKSFLHRDHPPARMESSRSDSSLINVLSF